MENSLNKINLNNAIFSANTGADAIKRAPIVEEDTGIKCLRIGDVSNSKSIEEWGFTKVQDDVFNKFQLKKNDIIIARTGNTIGVVKFIDEDINAVYNNGLIRIKVDETKYNPKYIFYNLISRNFKDHVYQISAGTSTQPNMKIKDMLEFQISEFELREQEKIASIMSSLDDKIKVNNEMNKTLEEMAQEVFKAWFVDFQYFKYEEFEESEIGLIPKGWRVGTLGEFIDVNPKTSLNKGEMYNFVDMGNVPTNSARVNVITERVFSGGGSRFKNGDVIFARITPCLENGKTAIIDFLKEEESGFGSTEFLVFRGSGWNAMYFGYCLSRYDKFRSYAVQHMNGSSGRQRVSKGDIENYKIVIPPRDILLRFNEQVCYYFQKIKQNDINSDNLKNIRDIILPKLISGEIRLDI